MRGSRVLAVAGVLVGAMWLLAAGAKAMWALWMRTMAPETMARGAASSGWIRSLGPRSSATNAGRLANEELRKFRAGGEMNASG